MPTNLLTTTSYEGDKSVLATEQGLRSPRMLTVDLDQISPDADGNKILKSGTVLVKLSSGYGAPYKSARLGAAVTTSATELSVPNAALFKAGDVLVIPVPYARLDLAGTWANADTATVVLDGLSVTHTVSGYSTLTALATAIAATLTTAFGSKVEVIAENQYVHLFGKKDRAMAISASESTAGDGTLTVANSATALLSGQSVETVSAIDVDDNTLTLSGAVDRRLPANAPIGVGGNQGEIYGMVMTTQLIYSSSVEVAASSNDVACYTSASVYRDRLPYWDGAIAAALPEITLV